MSKVYACESKLSGEKWAVKIMEKRLLTPERKGRFEAEINLMAKIEHPNIISIYEWL